MNNVEFNDETQTQRTERVVIRTGLQKNFRTPTMVHWLMKLGVKSESFANAILIVIVVVIVALTFIIYRLFLIPPTLSPASTLSGRIPLELQNAARQQ